MLVDKLRTSGFMRLIRPLVYVCGLIPPVAHGEDSTYGIQLTPFAGYRFGGEFEDKETGETLELDDDVSYGLIFNYPYTDYTEWEIYYSQQSTSVDAAGFTNTDNRFDMDIDYLQIEGITCSRKPVPQCLILLQLWVLLI